MSRLISHTSALVVLLILIATPVLASDWKSFGKSLFGATESKSTVDKLPATADMSSAFKQALNIGVDNVIGKLGVKDGFNLDPKAHIPLPPALKTAQSYMSKAGLSPMLDDLEERLNQAAEKATPHAKELFVNAIKEMQFEDVKNIYNGPKDSATQYFRGKMSKPLSEKLAPFATEAISEAGVVKAYDQVTAQYSKMPFMSAGKTNLTEYVVEKTIDGIFFYLGQEEAAIREDPARHTTELLKKVFAL